MNIFHETDKDYYVSLQMQNKRGKPEINLNYCATF